MTPEAIDALLPQTQCGLCGYGGCLPYANAIVQEDAPLNLCPPGGCQTLQALGQLMHQDVSNLMADMRAKEKPLMLAIIREQECIGCTKCIQACPVDAIMGSAKQMHTVLNDYCTGCELCVPACPVDCIEMIDKIDKIDKIDMPVHEDAALHLPEGKPSLYRRLYQEKQQRVANAQSQTEKPGEHGNHPTATTDDRQAYILAAIARSKLRRGL